MKTKVRSILLSFLTILSVLTLTTSCNSNDPAGPGVGDLFFDIATLESATDNGSTFTLRKDGDSPLVTLTSTVPKSQINADYFPVGCRLLIGYLPESGEAYVSGPVTLYILSYVYNGVIQESTAEATTNWNTASQQVNSIWRTGNWLNFHVMCDYASINLKPNKYDLVVDETTLNDEYPKAYVIYEPDTRVNSVTQNFYASFNIAEVWNLPHVKGLQVQVLLHTGERLYTFKKDQQEVTPID